MNAERLIRFVNESGEQTLTTLSRAKRFRVEVDGDGLVVIPESSGIPRRLSRKHLNDVCDAFNRLGSFRKHDYQQLSANGSYILALIRRCQTASLPGAPRAMERSTSP